MGTSNPRPKILVLILTTVLFSHANGQNSNFLSNFSFGFGGGINFSEVNLANRVQLYENLDGSIQEDSYSGIFKNPGSQYFFQLEYSRGNFIFGLRPGTYTYIFDQNTSIALGSGAVRQENTHLLRYFNLPLDIKYSFREAGVIPYAGISLMYGNLLGSSGIENNSFIHTRLSTGVIAGAYMDLRILKLHFGVGYDYNPHVITQKDRRFSTSTESEYLQSDIKLNDLHFSLSFLFNLKEKRFPTRNACNTYK
jgi:hypothetical protein